MERGGATSRLSCQFRKALGHPRSLSDECTGSGLRLPRMPGGTRTYLRTSGLPPGDGFVVGRTQEGYRYQPVRFVDHMKVKCKTVSVVTGPPEPRQ